MSEGLLKMAEGYELIAAGMRALAQEEQKAPAAKTKKSEPKVAEPKAEEKAEEPKETGVDRITVKTYLTEKSRSGKTQEVRNLIVSMGYEKLTDVPDEKLTELYQKAQVL